jgi:hypothetical protein
LAAGRQQKFAAVGSRLSRTVDFAISMQDFA